MTIASWPEWLPDQADFGSQGSPLIKNCVPLTPKSYGPMPTAVPLSTNTLDARCQGSYSVKAPDNSISIYAGDHTKLYRLPTGSLVFVDATRVTGGAYNTPDGGFWAMTSFGTRIIATNGIDPPQTLLLPTDTHFSLLSAGAPVAKYCAVVKDFLFLGNTTDPVSGAVPYRIWWSSINDPTSWPTPGAPAISVQSDYQELVQTDLGNITGLVGGFATGADVIIFMERGIVTGNYAGPPLIFSYRTALGSSGTVSPLSIVNSYARTQAGNIQPVVYYLSGDGFAAFDGSTSFPIGSQKFDRTFYRLVDDAYINRVQGTNDPRTRSILWAFPSIGSGGILNKVLIYNWELSRASLVELDDPAQHVEYLTTAMFGTSHTLDGIDAFGDLDTIQPSFDDPFWAGNTSMQLSLFDPDHRLNIGGGAAMAPTLETAELQPAPGRRAWISLVRPLIDAGIATVAVGHRERLQDPVIWEPPVSVNYLGECPQRVTGRYIRFRMSMPAAQEFRNLLGIDLQLRPEGMLR